MPKLLAHGAECFKKVELAQELLETFQFRIPHEKTFEGQPVGRTHSVCRGLC